MRRYLIVTFRQYKHTLLHFILYCIDQDFFLQVSGRDSRDATPERIIQPIRRTSDDESMAVSPDETKLADEQRIFSVELTKEPGQDLGFRIGRQNNDTGIFISVIVSILGNIKFFLIRPWYKIYLSNEGELHIQKIATCIYTYSDQKRQK